MNTKTRLLITAWIVPGLLILQAASLTAGGSGKDGHGSALSDEAIPLQIDTMPARPKPLLEWGEPFLGTGTLSAGFELPTGAVWQPSLLAFGSFRTAVQSNGFDPVFGDARTTEAVARLDLFANLQLSGSERLVLGFRNLDQDNRFTSYVFDSDIPGLEDGSQEEFNAEIGSLFFEGDIGEIFPNISPNDFLPTDIGFSVGRQPLFFQEGMLINDIIDGIGFTLNSMQPRNTSNLRTTLFFGWNEVNRFNIPRDSGRLVALLTSVDMTATTMDIDATYLEGENGQEDAFNFGISAVQRLGLINTSFRLLASLVDTAGERTEGFLAFSEVSWTPHYTHDLVYITNFWVMDTYAAAASGPGTGGPLGRAGINFAAVGLGNYGAPLSSAASDVAGGAVGYQKFFDHTRQQLIVELGARVGTADEIPDQFGLTGRYQIALGRRYVIVTDAFANHGEAYDEDLFFGGRIELQVRL